MPPSKGRAEQGYTLQAQEQGTGTMPHRRWDSQGTPSLSLWEGEEGDWGEPRWARGCGQHSLVSLVLGGPPRKRNTPSPQGRRPLHVGVWMLQCAQCGGLPIAAGESPSAKPPGARAARTAPAARVLPGSRVPAVGPQPGGVLARAPFCHQRTESTGVQLVPDRFSSVLRGKCFLPILYFTSCCLLVGGSSFHTRPQTWRSLPFSPRCHFPGD